MIIVKLMGGLGNQMFQYAVARALSIKNNTNLLLDVSFYENQIGVTERKFELDVFNIKAEIPAITEIKKIYKKYFEKSIRNKILFFLNPDKAGLIYNDTSFNFDLCIYQAEYKNIYLNGYFQSEKYFKDIKDIIQRDFTLINTISNKSEQVLKKIKKLESVSIHLRRGDYVNDFKTNQVHGVCSLDYYENAINYINRNNKNICYFVFSDDIEWTKANLKIDGDVEFVDSNDPDKNYEDMFLMSQCKHNIIANSSFSWWGAWLNQNPDKIVIVPKKWFNDSNRNIQDLIPETWIKI